MWKSAFVHAHARRSGRVPIAVVVLCLVPSGSAYHAIPLQVQLGRAEVTRAAIVSHIFSFVGTVGTGSRNPSESSGLVGPNTAPLERDHPDQQAAASSDASPSSPPGDADRAAQLQARLVEVEKAHEEALQRMQRKLDEQDASTRNTWRREAEALRAELRGEEKRAEEARVEAGALRKQLTAQATELAAAVAKATDLERLLQERDSELGQLRQSLEKLELEKSDAEARTTELESQLAETTDVRCEVLEGIIQDLNEKLGIAEARTKAETRRVDVLKWQLEEVTKHLKGV